MAKLSTQESFAVNGLRKAAAQAELTAMRIEQREAVPIVYEIGVLIRDLQELEIRVRRG